MPIGRSIAKRWLALALLGLAMFSPLPSRAEGSGNAVPTKQTALRSNSERKVSFESTRNTRDLGGLPTRHGHIKNRLLYRSGALCYATPKDVETIASLKLRTIVDLRSPREIKKKEGEDRLPLRTTIHTLYLPMYFKGDTKIGRYYSYALDNDEALQGFFAALAKRGSYPLLYHCSAGKDRTGVLTCLLLELLGTERAIIMDDYMQSQRNSPKLETHYKWIKEIFGLVDKAGGVVPFLQQQGVAAKDLNAIEELLVDKR